MPREYRSTGGPASPSPTGFGSADLSLQNPRFVAQTNVAQPQNVFAALQEILGVAAQAGGQLLRYEAEGIEGKLSYEKALEAKQERETVKANREEARKAAEYSAGVEERIAKAGSPEEAQAIRAEILKSMDSGDTAEMRSTKARLAQASESEYRQRKTEAQGAVLEDLLAQNAQGEERILNALKANDTDALESISFSYNVQAMFEPDARKKDAFLRLSEDAHSKRQALEARAEIVAKKQADALETAAKEAFAEPVQSVVTEYEANISKFAEDLKNISDQPLDRALFDTIRNKLLENPRYAALIETMSEQEEKAVSDLIRRESSRLLTGVINQRNAEHREAAVDLATSAHITKGLTDFPTALTDVENDDVLDPAAKNRAIGKIVKARIDAAETPVEKLKTAQDMRNLGSMAADTTAVRNVRNIMAGIAADVKLERDSLVDPSRQSGDELSVGWTSRYKSKEEFLTDILRRRLGTDLGAIGGAPDSVKEFAAGLSGQWDDDESSKGVNTRRRETEIRRSDAALRRTMKIADAWDSSPLVSVISSGDHQKMTVAALEPLVRESLTGYSDDALPADLKKLIVTNFDDPKNFTLIAAYWKVQEKAMNPQARNEALADPKTKMSWGVGLYVNQLGPEVDPGTAASRTIDFVSNLNAHKAETADSAALQDRREKAFGLISGGAGLSEGWLDVTGLSAKDAMATIPPADVELMMSFAAVAACAPGDGDSSTLMGNMMRQSGYAAYPVKDDAGNTSFRIIQNQPVFRASDVGPTRATTPLPPPAVLETGDWKDYVQSVKPDVLTWLNETPTLNTGTTPPKGSEYKLEDIEDVRIVIYDTNTRNGFTSVKAKVSGRWISVPTKYVQLSAEDYESKRSQREVARQEALKSFNQSYKERASFR